MEFLLGAMILLLIGGVWLVGSRRQRKVAVEQRAVLERLQGHQVTADVVVGMVPMTRGVQLVATLTFVVEALRDGGSHVAISNVHVHEIGDGRDASMVAASLERDGLDAGYILSITGPDGDRHEFDAVQLRKRRRGSGE